MRATPTAALAAPTAAAALRRAVRAPTDPYSLGWLVLAIELAKLSVYAAVLMATLKRDPNTTIHWDPRHFKRLAVPSCLAPAVNWLAYAGLANLGPLLYQVVCKTIMIVATA